jgi:ribosomal protein S18 acetylase RimI-like enzyme
VQPHHAIIGAMPPSLVLRSATADDAEWIFSQVPRLHEFGPPPWRTVEQMNAAEVADLRAALARGDDPERLFVMAQQESDGLRLGFLYVVTLTDFFTGERHAHIGDIVVAREGEGQGVGRTLMSAAESWAESRGYRFVTLSVFPSNTRALSLYEHLGFRTDVLRMLKVIGSDE